MLVLAKRYRRLARRRVSSLQLFVIAGHADSNLPTFAVDVELLLRRLAEFLLVVELSVARKVQMGQMPE